MTCLLRTQTRIVLVRKKPFGDAWLASLVRVCFTNTAARRLYSGSGQEREGMLKQYTNTEGYGGKKLSVCGGKAYACSYYSNAYVNSVSL